MGTLLGHALPGSFFLLFACWRLVQIVRRQQLLRRQDDVTDVFYNSAIYPCYAGCCARWPIEAAFKVIVTTVGMVGELWASTDYGRADHVVSIGDIQHVTMYSLFFLSGVVDLVVWCCPSYRQPDDISCRSTTGSRRRCWSSLAAPPGVDFVALSLGFVGEALLFSQHTHGRTEFDKLLHYLLVYVMASTAVSVLIEGQRRLSLNAALATVYLLFVQGTWFFQVGLLLYPPSASVHEHIQSWLYNKSDDDQTTLITMLFCWHLAADFLLILIFYVILHKLFAVVCRCACAKSDAPFAEYSHIYNDICYDVEQQ